MARTLTLELTDEEEAEVEATFQSYVDEMRRLSEQRARDDREIARLRAETEAIVVDSRAIAARTQEIVEETRRIAVESRAIGEESKAIGRQTRAIGAESPATSRQSQVIGEQMRALRQETLTAIASLGAN